MRRYVIEHKTSKGWEIVDEAEDHVSAMRLWNLLIATGVEARLTAEAKP